MADVRLIDAKALRKGLREAAMESDVSLRDVLTTIDLFPTIDAVPVVRCRECKFNTPTICHRVNTVVKPWDYCSYGKRKEDAHAE